MFKKVTFIIILLFILLGNHVLAPSKNSSFINAFSLFEPFHQTNIAYAADRELNNHSKTVTSSWSPYIVPGTVGIILIAGIGSYWLIFRKRQI